MIIADASVVVKTLVAEVGSEEALSALQMADEVVAPNLLYSEVANVLRRAEKIGRISREQCIGAADHLLSALDRALTDNELISTAIILSIQLDHSVYDCMYLAASVQSGAVLLTSDDKFLRKAHQNRFESLVMGPKEWIAREPASSNDLDQAVEQYEKTLNHISSLQRSDSIENRFSLASVRNRGTPLVFESIPYRTILNWLHDAGSAERARLLALAWIGRGHGQSHWPSLYENARGLTGAQFEDHAEYIVPLMKYVRAGLEKFADTADFRKLHFPDDN